MAETRRLGGGGASSYRTVPSELEAAWLREGHWTDESLGEVLDRDLRVHSRLPFAVHSEARPWTGTLGEVHDRARRVAGAMRDRGIGPDSTVAFQLPNCVEAAITFYAVALRGAAIVPIVHFYGPKEVSYILRNTGPEAFVTMDAFGSLDFLAGLDAMSGELEGVDLVAVVGEETAGRTAFADLEAAEPVAGPEGVDPRAPALVAFTSGTTADPKGVVHSHRTIGAEIRQVAATQPEGKPPNLNGAPVGHAIGMMSALLLPVVTGEPVHLIDVWDPARVLRVMREHRLRAGSGSTFFLQSLLEHPDLTPDHLELMRFTGLGGSAVPSAVAERARDAGISLVRMYGSTEHPTITGATLDDPEHLRISTDGRPLAGVEIRLVDDHGSSVTPGEPGEILSRGPDCCIGYTDPVLTRDAFDEEGWFHTGDVGILDEEGWLRITDRLKDIIIRGGENVSAQEVEQLLLTMPGVAEAVVVAGPDPRLGERVVAFLRMKEGETIPTLEEVRSMLAGRGLARQKWPEELHSGDDLPRTPSGKVQKALLRRRLQRSDDVAGAGR